MTDKTETAMSKKQAKQIWASATYKWQANTCDTTFRRNDYRKFTIKWEIPSSDAIAKVQIIRVPFNGCWESVSKMLDGADDLRIVGSCLFPSNNTINTEKIAKQLTKSNLYYIAKIYVAPEFRGCGIGADILKNLHRILAIHTREENPVVVLIPAAIEFRGYTQEWYKMTKRLKLWYVRNGFTLAGEGFGTGVFVLRKSILEE